MRHHFLRSFWLLLLPSLGWCADAKWPDMKEVAVSFGVDTEADKVEINLPLYDRAGKVQYLFWCRGGNEEYLANQSKKLQSENFGVDFLVRPFSCGLNSATKIPEYSLLGEDEAPMWHTRAQYHYHELIGKCGDYPEFGRVRTFRLRGFRLTLTASDVKVDQTGEVKYFRLDVSLKADKSATGPIAQRPDYLQPYGPGRSCEIVLKGREPRYCRDWESKGGSWDLCKD